MKNIIFLGGTCGNNHWREEKFIPKMVARGISREKMFNPVVKHWTPDCQKIEDGLKAEARFVLYYLGFPYVDDINRFTLYSWVEATLALYEDQHRTVVVIDKEKMEHHLLKAAEKIYTDLKVRFPTANIFTSIDRAVSFLSQQMK